MLSNPQPPNPYARRLEQVRASRGFATLKDFREALIADGSYQVSYSAVRYYHFDRDPPVDYLVRVAETMDVPLEWLATGNGPATGSELRFEQTRASAPKAQLRGADEAAEYLERLEANDWRFQAGAAAEAARRDALERFALLLQQTAEVGTPIADEDVRLEVLRVAALLFAHVDAAFETVQSDSEFGRKEWLRASTSRSWLARHYDRVLDLLADRVVAVGLTR